MKPYCDSIFTTSRRKTREVMVGSVGIGGNNPIRIQSMTTSNTRDIEATIDQTIRLADLGCELVRITVQGIKEADSCEAIKNGLIQKGYNIPLVADIHFFPPAAFRVADFVDKIRINPGNFVDKRANFKVLEYDDMTYALELEKIEEKFTPLVLKCKQLKRAIRIGTNHGSLSDRIMNRYGDTPQGMVESALEFARVARKNDFHDLIFSMKASNPQVMILAYRLLAAEMYQLGWDYPLHLGVTEAGQGEDGRIKSAMGIGSLLLDGLGDTIRVSLTEDPWHEIDPCKRLVKLAEEARQSTVIIPFTETVRKFDQITPRAVDFSKQIPLHKSGTVMISLDETTSPTSTLYKQLGCKLEQLLPKLSLSAADAIVTNRPIPLLEEAGMGRYSLGEAEGAIPLLSLNEALLRARQKRFNPNPAPFGVIVANEPIDCWQALKEINPPLICFSPTQNRLHQSRHFFETLAKLEVKAPVILAFEYSDAPEDLVIKASAECGSLLCDGLGDGLWLKGPYEISFLRELSFGILQAARKRIFKTDFISCPSCGRTLFDLQDVTKRISERTVHLAGVKIAIMGCIVNGPGEMADADFGYVGSKAGKIDLYVGKTCVEKDINFAEADDRLVALIKKEGRWIEPEKEECLL